MRSTFRPGLAVSLAIAALFTCGGCVERTMKINTQPAGARVFVNDEEIGLSPARVAFTWYGDYDIVIRNEGFETLKTHYRVSPPWHQYPPFDFVGEVMVPGTISDEHVLPTYELQPLVPPDNKELVNRAIETQEKALFEGR